MGVLRRIRRLRHFNVDNPPPPPPPPPIDSVYESTYNVRSTGLMTIGDVAPEGELLSTDGVQVADYTTQTNALNYWPDGSIKHFSVSFNATSTGNKAVTSIASPLVGGFVPTWPSATCTMVVGGVTWVATCTDYASRNATTMNGDVLNESWVIVPFKNGGTDHGWLKCIFDIRSYVGGGHRVDVCPQTTSDVATGNRLSNPVLSVTVDGAAATYTNYTIVTGRMEYTTRFKVRGFSSGFSLGDADPDTSQWVTSGIIPNYRSTISATRPTFTASLHVPTHFGNMKVSMPDPGLAGEMAPLPELAAKWLVHKDTTIKADMLAQASQCGSYTHHWAEADGYTLVDIDTQPNWWTRNNWTEGTFPSTSGPVSTAWNFSTTSPGYGAGQAGYLEAAHIRDICYLPYLITCDKFYLDEMRYWANFTLLAAWSNNGYVPQTDRQGSKGLLNAHAQVRAIGWGLRNLTNLAAMCRDDDPLKDYWFDKVENNLDWMETTVAAFDEGPLGMPTTVGAYPPNGRTVILDSGATVTQQYGINWSQYGFLAWAIYNVRRHGLWGANRADVFLNRICNFSQNMINLDTGWPPTDACGLVVLCGTINGSSVITWDATWAAAHARSNAASLQTGVGPRLGVTAGFWFTAGYYGSEQWLINCAGANLGIDGCAEALAYITNSTTVETGIDSARAGFAIAEE